MMYRHNIWISHSLLQQKLGLYAAKICFKNVREQNLKEPEEIWWNQIEPEETFGYSK